MIDLSKPRWDQNTYMGRLLHFASITNPVNLVKALDEQRVQQAKTALSRYEKEPKELTEIEANR
jgi:hypothetical protein